MYNRWDFHRRNQGQFEQSVSRSAAHCTQKINRLTNEIKNGVKACQITESTTKQTISTYAKQNKLTIKKTAHNKHQTQVKNTTFAAKQH